MSEPLGGRTVTVIEQVRGQHNTTVDGTTRVYPGCSLQGAQGSETAADGRRWQETAQWRLFAPPGFRAGGSDVCTVVPGPTDDAGVPLRLSFVGRAQPWLDETGVEDPAEDHVEATLRLVAG